MEETYKKPNGYWTLERCLQSAKKYKTRTEWANTAGSPYHAASKNGWLTECARHMKSPQKPKGYWTEERCQEDAAKFKTRKEWFRKSSSAYLAASRNGWLKWCCRHMLKLLNK